MCMSDSSVPAGPESDRTDLRPRFDKCRSPHRILSPLQTSFFNFSPLVRSGKSTPRTTRASPPRSCIKLRAGGGVDDTFFQRGRGITDEPTSCRHFGDSDQASAWTVMHALPFLRGRSHATPSRHLLIAVPSAHRHAIQGDVATTSPAWVQTRPTPVR